MRVEHSEHSETTDIQVTLELAELEQIRKENPEVADDKEFAGLSEFALWFNQHGAPTGVSRGTRKAKSAEPNEAAVITSQAALIHSVAVAHPHALELLRIEREAAGAAAREGKPDAQ